MYPRTMGIVQVGSKSPVVQVFMGVGVGGGDQYFDKRKPICCGLKPIDSFQCSFLIRKQGFQWLFPSRKHALFSCFSMSAKLYRPFSACRPQREKEPIGGKLFFLGWS